LARAGRPDAHADRVVPAVNTHNELHAVRLVNVEATRKDEPGRAALARSNGEALSGDAVVVGISPGEHDMPTLALRYPNLRMHASGSHEQRALGEVDQGSTWRRQKRRLDRSPVRGARLQCHSATDRCDGAVRSRRGFDRRLAIECSRGRQRLTTARACDLGRANDRDDESEKKRPDRHSYRLPALACSCWRFGGSVLGRGGQGRAEHARRAWP
jgi:hypothetical protein